MTTARPHELVQRSVREYADIVALEEAIQQNEADGWELLVAGIDGRRVWATYTSGDRTATALPR